MTTTKEYAPRTLTAYRSRLKVLKAAMAEGMIQPEDLKKVNDEIVSLTDKLGSNIEPSRPQGRPKKYVKLTMAEVEMIRAGKEIDKLSPGYWSPEAIEMRRKIKQMQTSPNKEEVDASAKALEDMKKYDEKQQQLVEKANEQLGGDDEGRK